MSQVKVVNNDLYIIFNEIDDVLISYKLDNGAEFDFYNNELAQIVLPNFESQLNRGSLENVPIELVDTVIDDKKIKLSIKILNDTINISLDCSSIIHKL
jgi:hypothetical protein